MTREESLFILKCLKEHYFHTKRFHPENEEKIESLDKLFGKLEILHDHRDDHSVRLPQDCEECD